MISREKNINKTQQKMLPVDFYKGFTLNIRITTAWSFRDSAVKTKLSIPATSKIQNKYKLALRTQIVPRVLEMLKETLQKYIYIFFSGN